MASSVLASTYDKQGHFPSMALHAHMLDLAACFVTGGLDT